MTWAGKLVSFLPLVFLLAVVAALVHLFFSPSLTSSLVLLFALYGLPLVSFRLHNLFWPLVEESAKSAPLVYVEPISILMK